MADLIETDEYPAGIYQLEQTDPVLGGAPNEATKAGVDNIPHLQLARRTRWLKLRVDQLLTKAIAATTLVAGLVRLSSATNSTSETEAATPKAIKATWDNAETRALKSTAVVAQGLATGGGNLGSNVPINVPIASQAEAEAGSADNRAMTPLRTMYAIAARLAARRVDGAGLAFGGGPLSADRTITVPDATHAEALAGTIATKAMSPLRVAHAIEARLAARSVTGAGLATGGGALSGDRTITVPIATHQEALAGEVHDTAMTPLRTAHAIAGHLAGRSVQGAGLATGGGPLSADRTITVPDATHAEALAGTIATKAMSPLRVAHAIEARLAARSVTGAGLATGGGALSGDRTITVPIATHQEALAGEVHDTAMTPLRTAHAIAGHLAGRSVQGAGLATGGGALSADRFITVPPSTQAQAEAGADHSTAMTPLRVSQAINNQYSRRSFAVNGYQVLPSGLILQWGFAESNSAGSATVLFPISFPGGCWNISLTDLASTLPGTHSVGVTNITSQGFTAYVIGTGGAPGFSGLYFMAIGR